MRAFFRSKPTLTVSPSLSLTFSFLLLSFLRHAADSGVCFFAHVRGVSSPLGCRRPGHWVLTYVPTCFWESHRGLSASALPCLLLRPLSPPRALHSPSPFAFLLASPLLLYFCTFSFSSLACSAAPRFPRPSLSPSSFDPLSCLLRTSSSPLRYLCR